MLTKKAEESKEGTLRLRQRQKLELEGEHLQSQMFFLRPGAGSVFSPMLMQQMKSSRGGSGVHSKLSFLKFK